MTHGTMIERVARAAAEAQGWRWDDDKQMVDRLASGQDSARSRDTWRKSARSMLAEMREPSLPMMEAANRHANILTPSPAVFYRVVIDAALAEG